jgi:hypothetical protein
VNRLHDNILRHPFFWSADRATAFLVGLGNSKLYHLSYPLLQRINQAIRAEMYVLCILASSAITQDYSLIMLTLCMVSPVVAQVLGGSLVLN